MSSHLTTKFLLAASEMQLSFNNSVHSRIRSIVRRYDITKTAGYGKQMTRSGCKFKLKQVSVM